MTPSIAQHVAHAIITDRHHAARVRSLASSRRFAQPEARRESPSGRLLAAATATILAATLLAVIPTMAHVPVTGDAPGPMPAPAPSRVIDTSR